jgi:hypothetical protein
VTYNPNASHNLTYPNSGKAPADTRWFYVKEPEYTHDEYDRLKIESARKTMETARKYGRQEDVERMERYIAKVEAEIAERNADTCPQCTGPIHESGFCPSCKEAVA